MESKIENRVAEFRKQRRITQEELASAVSVSRQTIISLENGKYIASLPLAHRLARYFETTIEELFIFDDSQDHDKEESLK